MPLPTPKQKLAISAYVAILTILILVIWGSFLKDELKINNPPKPVDNTVAEIKSGWQKFMAASRETWQQVSASLKKTNPATQAELEQNLIKRALEELFQKRIVNWLAWENEAISFKYPAAWSVEPKTFANQPLASQKITLTNYNEKGVLLPAKRVKIEISFKENPKELTASQWQENLLAEEKMESSATSSSFIIDEITGIRLFDGAKQLVYLPLNKQIMELNIAFSEQTDEELLQSADDFIKTIKIIKK